MIDRRVIASLSAAGLIAIAGWESFAPVAEAPVPGDVPTIAFGHTGPDVKLGKAITVERGLILLNADAGKAASAVQRCAPVPMHQWEFDAYTSLTFNIGESAFCGSTAARRLRAGDYPGACSEILRWDKFHGRPLRGLTRRRHAEYQMCITDPAAAPSLDTGSLASARGAGT